MRGKKRIEISSDKSVRFPLIRLLRNHRRGFPKKRLRFWGMPVPRRGKALIRLPCVKAGVNPKARSARFEDPATGDRLRRRDCLSKSFTLQSPCRLASLADIPRVGFADAQGGLSGHRGGAFLRFTKTRRGDIIYSPNDELRTVAICQNQKKKR